MATVEELRLEIKASVSDAVNKLKQYDRQTRETSSATKSMQNVFASMRDAMQGPVAAFNSIVGAIGKVVNEAAKLYNEFAQAERATITLNTAIATSGEFSRGAAGRISDFADELQRSSIFEADATKAIMANLAAMGLSEKQMYDLVTAASNLSAATGIDLDSAVKQLNATLQGSAGVLGRQNSAIKSLTEEQLKHGKAIEIINQQYAGMASSIGNSALGASEQLKNNAGDLREELGAVIAMDFKPLIKNMTDSAKIATDEIKKYRQKQLGLSWDEWSAMVKKSGQTDVTSASEAELKALGVPSVEDIEAYLKLNESKYKKIKDKFDKLVPKYGEERAKLQITSTDTLLMERYETALKMLEVNEKIVEIEDKRNKDAKQAEANAAAAKKAEEDRIAALKEEQEAYAAMTAEKKKAYDDVMKWANEQKEKYLKGLEEQLDAENTQRAEAADKRVEIIEDTEEKERTSAEKVAEFWKSSYGTITSSAMDTWNAINGFIEDNNDRYLKNLEEQGAGEETLKAEKNRLGKQEFDARKLTSIASIAISTAEGAMKAFASMPPPGGAILAGIVTAAGAVQAGLAAAQQYVPMAEGGAGIVTKPTLFLAGEAGPEPFAFGGANNKRGMNMGSTVNITFNGSPWAIAEAEAVAMSAIAKANRGY